MLPQAEVRGVAGSFISIPPTAHTFVTGSHVPFFRLFGMEVRAKLLVSGIIDWQKKSRLVFFLKYFQEGNAASFRM